MVPKVFEPLKFDCTCHINDIPNQKRNAYSRIFLLSGVRSNIHLFHLYSSVAQSHISFSLKFNLIQSKAVFKRERGQNQISQMFKFEVWSPSMPDKLYTVDNFIDGDFTRRKGKLNYKSL